MLLVIDVGNTQTVLGLFEGEEIRERWRIATIRGRTGDEYAAFLDGLFRLRGRSLADVEGVVVSSVVPPAVEALSALASRYLGAEPLVVGPGVKTGMPILYDNPREVGADRIVNAVAAHERLSAQAGGDAPTGAIVVDFGTATTFDVISPRGEYLGGAITPGVRIAAEALFQRASKLPRIELKRPEHVLGKNTIASMQSGIVFGYVSLVDGMVDRLAAELDFPVAVFATGGVAPLIASESARIDHVDPDLTLHGLRIIAERNPAERNQAEHHRS